MRKRTCRTLRAESLESRVVLSADAFAASTLPNNATAPVEAEESTAAYVATPGDANQDGVLDQRDFVQVQQAGKYLTGEPANWAESDWNGDSAFDQKESIATLQAADSLGGTLTAKKDPDAAKDLAAAREATAKYHDIDTALADGYVRVTPCVSDPDLGAQGFHYLNGDLLGDGVVDPTEPEFLLYVPSGSGGLRLVGVEYAAVQSGEPDDPVPSLFGQDFHEAPAAPLWVLHAWVVQANPNGTFEDWNPNVRCSVAAPSNGNQDVVADADQGKTLDTQGASEMHKGLATFRRVTARYHRVEAAIEDGFVQVRDDCADPDPSPGTGKAGIPFVNPGRVPDGTINLEEPNLLLYEPQKNGELRLVGAEYWVSMEDWHETHDDPPTLFGHEFHANPAGLPLYGIHVWWGDNPEGQFALENPKVTCEV